MSIYSKQLLKIIILLIAFGVIYLIYNFLFHNNNFISQIKIADIPYSIKCIFKEPGCEEGNIDGWSICLALVYFIIGLIVPHQYITILVISILLEVIKTYTGNNSRYIINPLISLTGYMIGSICSTRKTSYPKHQILVQ